MEIATRTAPAGIVFSSFESEKDLPAIMSLVEKDLSEPYSIFTYRYFVLGWPHLTILAREESNNNLLGVIVCKADRQNRRKRLRGYIAMLAVEKEQRKRGIGSYLAYLAILKMKELNCDEVVLETELSNASALSLYERFGFIRDKRLYRYYLNGGDAFRLKLWFTSPSWDDGTFDDAPVGAEQQVADATTKAPSEPVIEAAIDADTTQPKIETNEPENGSNAGSASKGKKNKKKA